MLPESNFFLCPDIDIETPDNQTTLNKPLCTNGVLSTEDFKTDKRHFIFTHSFPVNVLDMILNHYKAQVILEFIFGQGTSIFIPPHLFNWKGMYCILVCQAVNIQTLHSKMYWLVIINRSRNFRMCSFSLFSNKAVLEPRVSPAFAITYFCNHCNIRFENTWKYMWIHWPFFPKTWTKGHWPLDDLWPMSVEVTCVTLPKDHCVQVPWQYINVCGYSDQFCKIPHTYTYYIHTTYYILHTTYRMSDHIVSYWTQFRWDKNRYLLEFSISQFKLVYL